jgi:predicted ATPase/class 3 adenylate cyclase
VQDQAAVTTFLFTDIEGSTRLWEEQPGRMGAALARHDALARSAVETHHGVVVKTTGDGIHAAFADPLDAVVAAVDLQRALAGMEREGELALRVRCGMHAGAVEHRGDDFFGSAVNRAARIMSAAHGGQVLLSQSMAEHLADRLPAGIGLRALGLVRLRDLAQPERIHQVVHAALRADFPPLRSLESTPNNLPLQLTTFIGREGELAEIAALLRRTRLVTVVGTGGLGKTRISLQVAAELVDDFPDGVWLVELASLTDPRLVPQAIASVLGVKDELGRSMSQALQRHCSDRTLLIVLDNCEHLVAACADIATQLVRFAPNVRILATSRERLNVAGETAYPLAPLVVMDPRDKPTLAALERSDAVRLFVERAHAVQPAFRVIEENAAQIAEICYRLDGIPLAIELAAARARTVSIATIAARLDDRFRLLTGGDRTTLPRQQTLRALIDWSHELLSEPERLLFARLAVFAGGFTLEAAEAIAADEELAAAEVLDTLAQLVEKSLVMLDAAAARYRMLESVREYAGERLEASGQATALRDRHLAYYVALAERAVPELFGPAQTETFARLDAERENLLAAHAWCASARDGVESGLRLAALKFYWIQRGVPGLGYRLGVEALARTRADDRSVLRCRALFDIGQMACYMGRYREGQAHLEESLAIAREIGNSRRIASALQPLAMACLGQGDADAAERHLHEALDLVRAEGSKHDLVAALNAMAQVHRTRNDLEAALPLYEQVVGLAREIGDRESVAFVLLNLAMALIASKANERIPAILLEVLALAEENRSKPALQSALEVSAGWAAALDDWERAASLFGVAEALAEATGLRRDPADEAFLAPLIGQARAALGDRAFADLEATGRSTIRDDAIADLRAWIGRPSAPARA